MAATIRTSMGMMEGSALGQLEFAHTAAPLGPGEGPFLIAEELALQQVFREGRHVDGHEGPVPPPGGPVDRVGEQLLAGAGLADQQDGALADPDHILNAVLGAVALVKQLVAQLALPGLHVVEPLQDGKRADAGPLPHHRHHLRADVDAVEADDFGRQPLPLL